MPVLSETKKVKKVREVRDKPSAQAKEKFVFNRQQIVQQFLCRGLDADHANKQTDTLVLHAQQDLHAWNTAFWKDWILHSHAISSAAVANTALKTAKKTKK